MTTAPVSPFLRHAMSEALLEAQDAARADEVPVGAVLMHTATGDIVVRTQNRMRRNHDGTAHAELLALQEGSRRLGDRALLEYTLVVTLEPCAMCAGAIVLARVGALVFGAWDDKAGMCGSVGDLVRHPRLNHHPEVRGGVLEEACSLALKDFFASRR